MSSTALTGYFYLHQKSIFNRMLQTVFKILFTWFLPNPKDPIPKPEHFHRPANWNQNLDDLFEELQTGKRKEITGLERKWAIEYEQEQMPSSFTLHQGFEVIADGNPAELSSGTYFKVSNYEQFEKDWVPAEIRNSLRYAGYSLFIDYTTLHAHFTKSGSSKSESTLSRP